MTANLAPVLGVVPAASASQNQRALGRYDRQFGADPRAVAASGAAFVRGMLAGGVAPTGKHFPGLGRVQGNTDTTTGVTDTTTTTTSPGCCPSPPPWAPARPP